MFVQADAAALRSAAPALNKFPTDGSFLASAMGDKARPPSSNPLQAALQAGQADTQSPASSPEHHVGGGVSDRAGTSTPAGRREAFPAEQGQAASGVAAGDRHPGVRLL